MAFWAKKEATNRGNFGYLKTIPLTNLTGPNALIFSTKQSWDKETQVGANKKVPGVINGPAPRGPSFV